MLCRKITLTTLSMTVTKQLNGTHCVLAREVPHPLKHAGDDALVMANVVGVVADVIAIPKDRQTKR